MKMLVTGAAGFIGMHGARKNFLPLQAADQIATYAEVDEPMRDVDFKPIIPIETGVKRFVEWYRSYHQL